MNMFVYDSAKHAVTYLEAKIGVEKDLEEGERIIRSSHGREGEKGEEQNWLVSSQHKATTSFTKKAKNVILAFHPRLRGTNHDPGLLLDPQSETFIIFPTPLPHALYLSPTTPASPHPPSFPSDIC